MITLSTRADGERRPGSVGQPVLGVETRLRTEDGQAVPGDGESIGRLQVRGSMLSPDTSTSRRQPPRHGPTTAGS